MFRCFWDKVQSVFRCFCLCLCMCLFVSVFVFLSVCVCLSLGVRVFSCVSVSCSGQHHAPELQIPFHCSIWPRTSATMESSTERDRRWYWWKDKFGKWKQVYHSWWRSLELTARNHQEQSQSAASSSGPRMEDSQMAVASPKKRKRDRSPGGAED